MNKKGNQILLSIIICILTVAIVLQVRSLLTRAENSEPSILEQTLSDVNSIKSENEELTKQRTDLLNEYESRIKALGDNELEREIKELFDKLSYVNKIAGLTEVSGGGIVFSISDRSKFDTPDEPLEQRKLIVHSYQVYTIVNELKKAGAQAISINNERIIPATEIFCTGGNIRINGNTYVPPYVIRAVGDPDLLYNGISSSTIFEEILSKKLTVDLKKVEEVLITKYNGNISNKTGHMTETERIATHE